MTSIRVRPYLRRHRRALAVTAGWTLLGVLPALLVGRLIASSVDAAADGRLSATMAWLAALGGLAVVGAVARVFLGRAGVALALAVRREITDDVVDGVLRSAVRNPYGRTASGPAVVWQLHNAQEMVVSLCYLAVPIGTVFASIIGLATLSPLLLVMLLPSVLLSVAVLVQWRRARFRHVLREMQEREAAAELVGRTMAGVRDVVALGAHDRAASDVSSALRRVAGSGLRGDDVNLAGQGAISVLNTWLPLIAILAASPALVRGGWLTPGEVVGAAAYIHGGALHSLRLLQGLLETLINLRVNLDRLSAAVAGGELGTERADPPSPNCGDVSLREVGFAYAATARPIASGLTMDLPLGDHLAVVGSSGIGKSTLANLIAGLLTPTQGTITIGGVDVRALDDATRRRTLAMVPQASYVFRGTVRENLAYLAPEATDAELDQLVSRFALEPVVTRLGGLDAQVSLATSGLSEGERQLITLARVWLSPARVVVLDEATCYLDPVAEARAERAFQDRPETTLIVIAHRMTSSLRAQRVLVMDGTGVQLGTHAELLGESPLYAELHGIWAAATA